MKASHLFLLGLFGLLISCHSKKSKPQFPTSGSSVIIGKIHDYHPKFCDKIIQLLITDILRDDTNEYLTQVDSAGKFQFHFDLENPREVAIRYASTSFKMLGYPDDTTFVELRVGNLDGFEPTVTLIDVKRKNLTNGKVIHDFDQYEKRLNATYETAPILEGSFEPYYDMLLKRKELKQSYLDSLLTIDPDLDTLLISWFEEDIHYDFVLGITNYYAINSMLNRGSAKRDPMSEGLFQNPIDMSYQQVADSILRELDIGISDHYVSATYAYFLNGLQAYDNWQYSKPEIVDYLDDYPHYLQERYSGDAFELMLTRFLYQNLYQIEKQYDRDRLNKFSEKNASWLTMLSGSVSGDFIEAEYERVSLVVETGKPKAIKYNLAAHPETENFWNNEILKRHKGKVLYVKLWAPWCGPCMGNWQSANNLIRKYNNEDFELISLCIDTDEDDWQKTITKQQIAGTHFLLSRDQSKVLMTSFGLGGIPYNLIIDKTGEIRFFDAITTGSRDGRINQTLVTQIDDLLNS